MNARAMDSIKKIPWLTVLIALFLASRLLFLAHTPYEWDSVNYLRAFTAFSIADDQPHPPGSLLYVLLGRLVRLLVRDDLRTLFTMNFLFGLLALAGCYRMGRLVGASRRSGLIAAFFFVFNPVTWFYGEVTEIYLADAAFSVFTAYFLLRFTKDKEEKEFLRATLLMGLTGGFRLNVEIFLVPLWAAVLFRYRRRPPSLSLAGYGFLLAAVNALWLIPTIANCGGAAEYLRLSQQTVRPFFETSSVLYGAPLLSHLKMIGRLGVWGAISAGTAVAGILLLRRGDAGRVLDRKTIYFLLLWAAPALLFFAGIYIAKPGYLLFVLPALFVACGVLIDRNASSGRRAFLTALLIAAPGVASLFCPGLRGNAIPYQLMKGKAVRRLFRYTLDDVRYNDRVNDGTSRLLAGSLSSERGSVLIFSNFYSWHFRVAQYYFPDLEAHFFTQDPAGGGMADHVQFQFGRLFLSASGGVDLRDRDAYLFIHEASAWGRRLSALRIGKITAGGPFNGFFIPAGSFESVDFSCDTLCFSPLGNERSAVP